MLAAEYVIDSFGVFLIICLLVGGLLWGISYRPHKPHQYEDCERVVRERKAAEERLNYYAGQYTKNKPGRY